ncbi:MAG: hypothetical protein U0325_01285 [Polyangiales bacterium]
MIPTRPTAPLLALAFTLSLGCTARSGGGGGVFIDPDAGSSADVTSAMDSAPPGDTPPGTDSGKTPDVVVNPGDDAPVGADVVSPPSDVPAGPSCGDGMCGTGETCTSCPGDCGACPPRCGDGMCGSGETCTNCPGDCGACPPRCGDGMCSTGETCTNCPGDCGACPARCGDGMCGSGETCTNCPGDCGACPTTCTATSCGACAENTACGWCRTTNSCLARAGSTCADFVTSASSCTTTPPLNITTACTATSTTSANDCGFRVAATYTCTPGSTVTFGCTGGSDAGVCGFTGGACAGDPVLRICAGTTTTGCTFAGRVTPQNAGVGTVTADDDACGLCPWVRIACPSAGSVTVFSRAYDVAASASCTLARM